MLFNLSDAWAQSVETRTAERQAEIKPLAIGDTIPEQFWATNLEILTPSKKLEAGIAGDYSEKELLVLDFWSTWCGSCITSMTHAELLVENYKDRVAVLPVTDQFSDDVQAFSEKNEIVRNTTLPIITDNNVFQRYFPHKSLPHVVFIRRGKVVHIGGGESISESLFQSLLNDEQKKFSFYKDDFSYENPLVEIKEIQAEDSKFYTVLTGYRRDSTPVKGIIADSLSNAKRLYLYNQSIFQLMLYSLSMEMFPLNRVIFENTDLTLSDIAYHNSLGNKIDWLLENAKCYEATSPMNTPDSLLSKNLSNSLRQMLGITFKIVHRTMPVLKMVDGREPDFEEREDSAPLSDIFDAYNRLPSSMPLIDPDGVAGKTYFRKGDIDLQDTRKIIEAIGKAGVKIDMTEVVLPVLVIKGRSGDES